MAEKKECENCKHGDVYFKDEPCRSCDEHYSLWESLTYTPPDTAPPDELDREAQYDWEKEFYRRMEINGYKRAEYIPEISDSVELFREFIQLGYFSTPTSNKR